MQKDPLPEVGSKLTAERLDVEKIRQDFPILKQLIHGKPLIYLDNAATGQKPQAVINTIKSYYALENSNIHRGVHYLSERATTAYEAARRKVQHFINAAESREIIFVRGTTEAVNLVSSSFGRTFIGSGDEILISTMEHHSNIVPWQILCEQAGAKLRVIPITDSGELLMDEYEKMLTSRTKLVAVVHVSNSLGTINPVKKMIQTAHARKIPVLLDGAQAVSHMKVDVRDLDCDFYAFSSHKVCGPTGVGVLYGKSAWLEKMPPYQGGGDMISSVTFEKTTYNVLPHKFEAGTPNISGVIGLGAALDYMEHVGLEKIEAYEHDLLEYATRTLSSIPELEIIGKAKEKAGILSFVLKEIHPHDIGTILDREGIAIRAGHHCTMPLMERLGLPATARASLSFYNTKEEIDCLVKSIYKILEMFK